MRYLQSIGSCCMDIAISTRFHMSIVKLQLLPCSPQPLPVRQTLCTSENALTLDTSEKWSFLFYGYKGVYHSINGVTYHNLYMVIKCYKWAYHD